MYILDASVYVADARPQEPHHAEAHALLAWVVTEGQDVYLPVIALAEVAAAISRGTGQPALAMRWIAAIQRIPGIQLNPIDETLARLAADLAAHYRIRGCDAVYVALARQRKATLVTLDRQQRDRVPPDVTARTPAEELALIKGGQG